ncbi:MAG: hypothetical protein U1F66_02445 [bacterium]
MQRTLSGVFLLILLSFSGTSARAQQDGFFFQIFKEVERSRQAKPVQAPAPAISTTSNAGMEQVAPAMAQAGPPEPQYLTAKQIQSFRRLIVEGIKSPTGTFRCLLGEQGQEATANEAEMSQAARDFLWNSTLAFASLQTFVRNYALTQNTANTYEGQQNVRNLINGEAVETAETMARALVEKYPCLDEKAAGALKFGFGISLQGY